MSLCREEDQNAENASTQHEPTLESATKAVAKQADLPLAKQLRIKAKVDLGRLPERRLNFPANNQKIAATHT